MELDGKENHPGLVAVQAAADSGDSKAQFQLGLDYLYGNHGVELSPSLAVLWLKKANEKKHPLTSFFLSVALEDDKKTNECIRVLQDLVEEGFLPSYARLASHYLRGNIVNKDIDKAKLLLKAGALKGHIGCNVSLSLSEVLHPTSIWNFVKNFLLLPARIFSTFRVAYRNPWDLKVLS